MFSKKAHVYGEEKFDYGGNDLVFLERRFT